MLPILLVCSVSLSFISINAYAEEDVFVGRPVPIAGKGVPLAPLPVGRAGKPVLSPAPVARPPGWFAPTQQQQQKRWPAE